MISLDELLEDYYDEPEDLPEQESYEPTDEEIDNHYRERAERYWENKK